MARLCRAGARSSTPALQHAVTPALQHSRTPRFRHRHRSADRFLLFTPNGLSCCTGSGTIARMPEIAQFVRRGAAQITPRIVRGVHKKLPFLKMAFTQIDAPNYPHLVEQLEFLANVVEDFAEGAEDDLPLVTVAGATFALIYTHREKDLIPDFVPEFGHADESAVVRAVLIEHEKVFVGYASRHQLNWPKLNINP